MQSAHVAGSESPPWSSDWASSSFCAGYGTRYTGTTFNGVASCGNAYPNNYQGKITYDGVLLDSVGFQCVELAARYLFYTTGHVPPVVQDASDYAYYIGKDYGYNVFPAGLTGVTHTYNASLSRGQVVSMWSSSDEVGHVGVVTSVSVTNGNGTITIMDENGSSAGSDKINVSGGSMSLDGYPDFQWTTNLPYSAPTLRYPANTYGPGGPDFSLTGQYWHSGAPQGLEHDEQWTYSNGSAAVDWATWAPPLASGSYDVKAYLPAVDDNAHVTYVVSDANGTHDIPICQAPYSDVWVNLGNFTASSTKSIRVVLGDNSPDAYGTTYVGVDAMEFLPI